MSSETLPLAQLEEGDVREDTSEATHRWEGKKTAAPTQDSTQTGDKRPGATASAQDMGLPTPQEKDDGSETKRCRKVGDSPPNKWAGRLRRGRLPRTATQQQGEM